MTNQMSGDVARCAGLFATLTRAQREILGGMDALSRREQALVGQDLIALAAKSLLDVPTPPCDAAAVPPVGSKRRRVDLSEVSALLIEGTGPAFDAIGERAVQHRYISQVPHPPAANPDRTSALALSLAPSLTLTVLTFALPVAGGARRDPDAHQEPSRSGAGGRAGLRHAPLLRVSITRTPNPLTP